MEDEWEDVPNTLPPSLSGSEDENESFLIEVDDADEVPQPLSGEVALSARSSQTKKSSSSSSSSLKKSGASVVFPKKVYRRKHAIEVALDVLFRRTSLLSAAASLQIASRVASSIMVKNAILETLPNSFRSMIPLSSSESVPTRVIPSTLTISQLVAHFAAIFRLREDKEALSGISHHGGSDSSIGGGKKRRREEEDGGGGKSGGSGSLSYDYKSTIWKRRHDRYTTSHLLSILSSQKRRSIQNARQGFDSYSLQSPPPPVAVANVGYRQLTILFVAACRALGFETRLVCVHEPGRDVSVDISKSLRKESVESKGPSLKKPSKKKEQL